MAARTSKITFSLDSTLLKSVERLRAQTGESRSALIARALAEVVKVAERERRIAAYVESYRAQPELKAETEQARRLTRKALAQLAWDDA